MPSRVRLAIVAGCVAAPLVAVGVVALSQRSSEQSLSPGEIVVIGAVGPDAQDDPNEPPPTPNPYAIDYPLPAATLELDLREVEKSVSAQAVADLTWIHRTQIELQQSNSRYLAVQDFSAVDADWRMHLRSVRRSSSEE